jgi:hypothetical protein
LHPPAPEGAFLQEKWFLLQAISKDFAKKAKKPLDFAS